MSSQGPGGLAAAAQAGDARVMTDGGGKAETLKAIDASGQVARFLVEAALKLRLQRLRAA